MMINDLPMMAHADELVDMVRKNQVSIVCAETGSGKSSCTPGLIAQALASSGQLPKGKMVVCVQPTRAAVFNLARWVAEQVGEEVGGQIGLQVGGEKQVSDGTKVLYATTGVLLQQMLHDPKLQRYACIVFDEAHVRGIDQDTLMALIEELLPKRQDLQLVIMSATLPTGTYTDHFGTVPVLNVEGRMFPVDIRYEDYTPRDRIAASIEKIVELVEREEGDILAFYPDEFSIHLIASKLNGRVGNAQIRKLYGALDKSEIRNALSTSQDRRIILATNIAETSVTVDGVVHVIDTGLVKMSVLTGGSMSSLEVCDHSQAGADQRAGRAGRTQRGVCHRLYTKTHFARMPPFTEPEIRRTALDSVLLRFRSLGKTMEEIEHLPFLDAPSEEQWRQAEATLQLYGALDGNGSITQDGELMLRMPVSPLLSKIILSARTRGCVREAAIIAIALQAKSVFRKGNGDKEQIEARLKHDELRRGESDALTLMHIFNIHQKSWEPEKWCKEYFLKHSVLQEIRKRLDELLDRLWHLGIEITSSDDEEQISLAVAAGLVTNLAVLSGRSKYTSRDGEVYIFPGSAAYRAIPSLIAFTTVVDTTKAYARGVIPIKQEWLDVLLPPSSVERVTQVKEAYMYGPPLVLEVVSYHGIELSRAEPKAFTNTIRDQLAAYISAELQDVQGCYNSWHPCYSDITSALRRAYRAHHHFGQEEAEWNDVVSAAHALLRIRIRSAIANANSMDDVLGCTFAITVEEIVSEDVMTRYNEMRAEEEAAEEAARRLAEQTRLAIEARRTAEREAWEAEIAPVRAQYEALKARFDEARANGMLDDGCSFRLAAVNNYLEYRWMSVDDLRHSYTEAASHIVPRISEHDARVAKTTEVTKKVLAIVPSCPLCGGAWSISEYGKLYTCAKRADHNRDRLIPPLKTGSNLLLTVQGRKRATDDASLIAFARFHEDGVVQLELVFNPRAPWVGTLPKQIDPDWSTNILPAELAQDRDAILADLVTIQEARAAIAEREARIAAATEGIPKSRIAHAIVETIDGRSAIRHNGTVYVIPYEADPYPNAREQWVFTLSDRGARTPEATPLLKIEGATQEELAEYEECFRESYQGLPEELFAS